MNFNRKGPCDTLKWWRIFYFRFNYFCTQLCTPPVFWLKADKTQYHQTVKVIRDTLLTPVENILFTLLCTLHQPSSIDQCLFLAVV